MQMFERIVSNVIIPMSFVVFDISDDVMDRNNLNFRERLKRAGEKIIKCAINKREMGGAGKVSGIRGEIECIEFC